MITNYVVEFVWECIVENRRFAIITELYSHFPQISRFSSHKFISEHLFFRKLSARWTPKQMTPEHKAKRIESTLTFLQCYHDGGDEFLDRTITCDETHSRETKQQSMHWRHSGSPCKTKFQLTLLARGVMCTVFWDRRGILLVDLTESYCENTAEIATDHSEQETRDSYCRCCSNAQ